jgi:hypothetical protein
LHFEVCFSLEIVDISIQSLVFPLCIVVVDQHFVPTNDVSKKRFVIFILTAIQDVLANIQAFASVLL